MLDEGVVFLSCGVGQRVEPVGVVGCAHVHGPFLHSLCNLVGKGPVHDGPVFHYVHHLGIYLRRQILEHFLFVEYVLSEVFVGTSVRQFHIQGVFLKGLAQDFKS